MLNYIFLLTVVSILLGVLAGYALASGQWRADMIERGYGGYCAIDGSFAFEGECVK